MLSKHKSLFYSFFFILAYAGVVTFAVPPLTQYTPGETLDPSCAPNDTNCSVEIPSFSGWSTTGNAGTDPAVNFIGTSDNQDVVVRRNNLIVGRWTSDNSYFSSNLAGEGATGFNQSIFHGYSSGATSTGNSRATFLGSFTGNASSGNTDASFIGYASGAQSAGNYDSFFGGKYAGYQTIGAYESVFLGENTGWLANNSFRSVFIGRETGRDASAAQYSFFVGTEAGRNAPGSYESIYLGWTAGRNAANAYRGIFLGTGAGQSASGANNSTFIGAAAGRNAIGSIQSFFAGYEAGDESNNTTNTVIIGHQAGQYSPNGNDNIYIGRQSGTYLPSVTTNILIGRHTGRGVTGNVIGSNNIIIGTNISLPNAATNSINLGNVLYGTNANSALVGGNPSIAPQANGQIGIGIVTPHTSAVLDVTSITRGILTPRMTTTQRNAIVIPATGLQIYNTITGQPEYYNGTTWTAMGGGGSGWSILGNAGTNPATNFIGTTNDVDFVIRRNNIQVARFWNYLDEPIDAFVPALSFGEGAGRAPWSNFFGQSAGQNAINARDSNFFGRNAGQNATDAINSNFFGRSAGSGAISAQYSNFFGENAGLNATSAQYSNFFGENAGNGATGGIFSNFLGRSAGQGATGANGSNFLGSGAGSGATNAAQSNFFGQSAGQGATGAGGSNFFGQSAGQGATSASRSNIFGTNAGRTFTGNNIGSNNIIIGTNISLPNATANAINLGGVLFGTNTYSTTTGDPSIAPATGGRIGIGAVLPVATLDVNGDAILSGANRYLNFGTTAGLSGYGLRDNAGVMEFKHSTGVWAAIPNQGWSLTGNAGANPSTNFIGTTDNQPLSFRTNNFENMTILTNGNVGIGAILPNDRLEVSGNIRFTEGRTNTTTGGVLNIGGSRFMHTFNYGNNGTVTTIGGNTFLGINAGNFTMGSTATVSNEASRNTGVGEFALFSNTIGNDNTAIGQGTLQVNTTGSNNTTSGRASMITNTTGSNNTASGRSSLQNNTTGSDNTAIGRGALLANISANNNVAVGANSLLNITTTSNNTAIGFNAGRFLSNGSTGNISSANSIFIGSDTRGAAVQGLINQIVIGDGAISAGSNSVVLGNTSILTTILRGNVGIGTDAPLYRLHTGNNTISGIVARFENSTGACDINPLTTALVCASDATLKSNIASLENALSSITELRPVTYMWNADTTQTQQVGFIAQEVEQVFPNLVFTDPTTGLKSLASTNLIPYTIKALQDINRSLITLDDIETPNLFRDALSRWFASATNGITKLFAREVETKELCISDESGAKTCLTKAQLDALLIGEQSTGSSTSSQGTTAIDDSLDSSEILSDKEKEEQNGDKTPDSASGGDQDSTDIDILSPVVESDSTPSTDE